MDDYPPKKAETKIKSCFNLNRVERSFSFRDSFRGCCSDVWHEAKAPRSGLNILSLQNIKCCSHKSWGYDFKLHSCALQIHSSNFGSCTSYKLEKEKLKPPWLTFLQLISPQPSDKNWTILLFNFFCSSSAIWHLFQLNACCNTIFPSHLILTLMWLK